MAKTTPSSSAPRRNRPTHGNVRKGCRQRRLRLLACAAAVACITGAAFAAFHFWLNTPHVVETEPIKTTGNPSAAAALSEPLSASQGAITFVPTRSQPTPTPGPEPVMDPNLGPLELVVKLAGDGVLDAGRFTPLYDLALEDLGAAERQEAFSGLGTELGGDDALTGAAFPILEMLDGTPELGAFAAAFAESSLNRRPEHSVPFLSLSAWAQSEPEEVKVWVEQREWVDTPNAGSSKEQMLQMLFPEVSNPSAQIQE
jgi:hypothetical protein